MEKEKCIYFVEILPKEEIENDYRTPCYFRFDDLEKVKSFLDVVMEQGTVVCTITPEKVGD